MQQTTGIEAAALRLKDLLSSDIVNKIQGANEAETRLQLIDEILAILGWGKHEYHPEKPTPLGGFTDYRLSIDNIPRLIVEAKRIGLIDPLPKEIRNKTYTNGFLSNSCGQDLKQLLNQCRGYCTECGVPFAVATTGDIWIILTGFRAGTEWNKLRSFVFHSLEDIYTRFHEFYSLISREAVRKNSLEEKFGSIVSTRPSIAIRPRDQANVDIATRSIPDKRQIDAYFETYMGDITASNLRQMLEHCYVEDRELNEYSKELQKLLEYDAILDELHNDIGETDEDKLKKELDRQLSSNRPKSIILVGNIGAGKSTFVHRFILNERPDKNVCVIVDMIDRVSSPATDGQYEEQKVADLVLNRLADEFKGRLNPFESSVLRGCFEVDLARFSQQFKNLQANDLLAFQLKEEEYIHTLTADKVKHLSGYLRYAKKKNFKAWVIFDNVDRGSDSYQSFLYSFAHRLSGDSQCVTMITMRADTYAEAEQKGFLDVRNSDIVFRISAPELRQVISKRRKYVDKLIEANKLPSTLRDASYLIENINRHINRVIVGDNDLVRALITTFSLGNVRLSLKLIQDYYASPHSAFHDYYNASSMDRKKTPDIDIKNEYRSFIQSMMLGGDYTYRDGKVFNVFGSSLDDKSSHFLSLRILSYLEREKNKNTSKIAIRYEKLRDDFVFLGHNKHHIADSVRRMLQHDLILSPSVSIDTDDASSLDLNADSNASLRIAISAKGFYYLNNLSTDEYYQTRAGEDTVWYQEEPASLFVSCLEQAAQLQNELGREDALVVTDARELFKNYLRRSLAEEKGNYKDRTLSIEWARSINDRIEKMIFGTSSLQTVDQTEETDELSHQQESNPKRNKNKKLIPTLPEGREQLSLFTSVVDYANLLSQAIKAIGPLPHHLSYHRSTNVVRVLWSLEIATHAGLSPIIASDIAKIINQFGHIDVEATNIAKFFRVQRQGGEFAHLWKEDTPGYFSNNSHGSALLRDLLKEAKKKSKIK